MKSTVTFCIVDLSYTERMGDMDNRFQKGEEIFRELFGSEASVASFKAVEEIAPGFGQHIVESAFGDIFCRSGLNLKQREMILIAVLTALGGCESWLGNHIAAGLNVGLTPREIVETMVHCSLPAGLPRTLNALTVAGKVFQEKGIKIVP